MTRSTKKKKTNENQEVVCSGLTSVAGFCVVKLLELGLGIEKLGQANFWIEWNVLSWNEGRNDDGSKSEDPQLRPHKPALVVVERLKGKGAEGINVSITENEPSAKQNPD